ncbi:hypothetical protein TV39_05880 [Arthrobacter sp. SPG23]|uniref:hypothetical protein n=1 Tax=Arthrobacter sp. SPG23 TaxID=1610703 RepID=UPI0005BD7DB4|nr:hypothetical protein [Arthrobacter sp. SPG23]KIS28320.1 hypothetical protein TV39_05880 [Arthrobacter sp. SPG23]
MKRAELAQHSERLGFTPRDAVRWLAPAQLGRTAVRVVLASVFADFGDKRELEGGFPRYDLDLERLPVQGQPAQPVVRDLELPGTPSRANRAGEPAGEPADHGTARTHGAAESGGPELWLDFAADLGDGFDSTYTVASVLAEESLVVDGHELRRGKVLVLGGDEVYPVAAPAAYEDRMVGPYRTALPGGRSPGRDGVLLALPGNHDWYDGLTSFIRLFTRQRNIGGWRTIQTRSYFGLRLTGGEDSPGWWLVGLDSQLGQYIDEPQLDYFYNTVTTRLLPGDAVILCVAAPYWVRETENANAFRQVHFFEQDYLRRRFNRRAGLFEETGASVRLWLTGDLHHYSRYEELASEADGATGTPGGTRAGADPRRTQLITCGLGGAFLADTRLLPAELTLPAHQPAPAPTGTGRRTRPGTADAAGPGTAPGTLDSAAPGGTPGPGRRFVLTPGTFPGAAESLKFRGRLANPFSPFWLPVRNPGFGSALGIAHTVAALTLWTVFSAFRGLSFVDSLLSLRAGNTGFLALTILAVPLLLLVLLVTVGAALGLSRDPRENGAGFTVARGALWQLSALGAGIAVVLLLPWPAGWPPFLTLALVLAIIYATGFAAGSEAFACFILGTAGGEVASWAMSGQAIEDHKGFLRIRVAADGNVTVYPVAVDRVCRDWDLKENDDGGIRPVPAGGLPPLRLFEPPVTVAREGFPP